MYLIVFGNFVFLDVCKMVVMLLGFNFGKLVFFLKVILFIVKYFLVDLRGVISSIYLIDGILDFFIVLLLGLMVKNFWLIF